MQTVSNNTLKQTLYYRDIPVLIYNIQYPAFNSTCSEKAAEAVSKITPHLQGVKRNTAKPYYTRKPSNQPGISSQIILRSTATNLI